MPEQEIYYSVMSPIATDTYSWNITGGKILRLCYSKQHTSGMGRSWNRNGITETNQHFWLRLTGSYADRNQANPCTSNTRQRRGLPEQALWIYRSASTGEIYFESVSGGIILGPTNTAQADAVWGNPGNRRTYRIIV